MGIGKYFYWLLWLPVGVVGLVSLFFFYISRFFIFCYDIAKGLHDEIKEF